MWSRPCTHPGCPELVESGRCAEHARQAERRRGSAHTRGYDREWAEIRKRQLSREPLCRHCKGRGLYVEATEVDHIVPMSRGGSKRDPNNLQSLCRPCHSRKTRTEDMP